MVLLLDPSFCFTGALINLHEFLFQTIFFFAFRSQLLSCIRLQSFLEKSGCEDLQVSDECAELSCAASCSAAVIERVWHNKNYNSKDNRRNIVVRRVLIREDGGDHTTVRTRRTRAQCLTDSLKDRNTHSQSESIWTCKT